MAVSPPWAQSASTAPPLDRSSPLGYALSYARFGWRVFPLHTIQLGRCTCGERCKSPGKHPRVAGGVRAGTTDEFAITRRWTELPDSNIGIALGRETGLWAVDIDPRKGGDDSFDRLVAELGGLPDTVEQLTGGGGRHLLFVYPDGAAIRNGNDRLGPGLDVKSEGGYIVAEPSMHLSGTHYAWEGSSDPFDGVAAAPTPAALLERVLAPPETPAVETATGTLADTKVAELRGALAYVAPDNRDTWLQVGMALHSTRAGQQAYGLWCEWSQGSAKFDPVDQARVWKSFTADEGITLSTVYGLAKQSGWIDPNASPTPTTQPPSESEHPARGLRLISLDELLTDPPRPNWLIRRIEERNILSVTYGQPGAAKSFLELDKGLCIAHGVPWHGHVVHQGAVIYVNRSGIPGDLNS